MQKILIKLEGGLEIVSTCSRLIPLHHDSVLAKLGVDPSSLQTVATFAKWAVTVRSIPETLPNILEVILTFYKLRW